MHNFSFGGINLLQFGGRILQAPSHTIAKRNVSFVKIYGQSGDELVDNGSYDNVDFSVKIAFMPFLTQRTARELAYAVINWLAPLQNDYYEYRDTLNNGYFTKAALTNFGEIKQELPTLLTATLKFNRVPYWYSDSGLQTVEFYTGSNDNVIFNPEPYPSEPIYKWVHGRSGNETVNLTVNGVTASVLLPVSATDYYFDNVEKQFYRISNNSKIYLGSTLLPNLQQGANHIQFDINGTLSAGSFHLEIIPNWGRL